MGEKGLVKGRGGASPSEFETSWPSQQCSGAERVGELSSRLWKYSILLDGLN